MVRHSLSTGAIVVGVCMLAACGGEPEVPATEAQVPLFKPIDPSKAGGLFNVPGASRYAGVLPCADCAGIRTELMLLQDPATGEPQIYELKETHLGSMNNDGEKTVTSRGKWTIVTGMPGEPGTTVYRLDGGDTADGVRSFERVSEQELRLLDAQGRRTASGASASLTRVADAPVLAFPSLPSTTPGTAPAPAPGVSQPAAMVTDMAAGWPINLRIGQEMTARLTADRSAGERWSPRAGSDGGVMAAEGAVSYEPNEGGGAGIEVHRFKAVKPGSITLTFDLKKGSSAAAIRSVSYPVTVQ